MSYTGLRELQDKLLNGSGTVVEQVEFYLKRIKETKSLNIYIEVFEEEALKRAKELDKRIKDHPSGLGKLFGLIVSIKDVICYEDHKVTAASRMLLNYVASYSATAIERLISEDAIIIGRVNCDEFAMGSANEHSIYGPCKNPVNPLYIPGGSSGGSAASIAAKTCMVSLGSDTGGSVRQPASFCGTIGFKPSYGRISRHGLIAYASSFDQIGILSDHIQDIEEVYEVISGPDEYDSTLLEEEPFESQGGINTRLAYFKGLFEREEISKEVRKNSLEFINKLKNNSFVTEPVEFEFLDYVVPTYYILASAEASSNLGRYDGVRYGYNGSEMEDLQKFYSSNRTEAFGVEVKRRIMMGTFVLSSGYYDAYYQKAQKMRTLIIEHIDKIFKDFDFILLPSSPVLPWKLGDDSKSLTEIYLSDIFTVIANICGLPAVSIPIGKNEEHLYSGMQIMGPRGSESQLFDISKQIKNWHRI